MTSGVKGAGFALLGFLLFSSHDAIIKTLGATYSPFQIIFFSVTLGFPLATFLLMRDETHGNLRPVYPGWIALRTVATLCAGASGFYAITVLPLSQFYAIIFATPLLITILSIPLLGERVGVHRWAAVLIGLIGVLVVIRPGVAPLQIGHAAGLACAVFGATGAVIVRRIGREERSLVLMLYPMLANVVVMGAMLPIVYRPMPIEHFGGLAAIAVLGFIGGLCIIAAYRNADAAVVAPVQYTQIVWSVIFGILVFNEYPDRFTVIGAGIIILSGLYIVMRESRAKTSVNRPVLRSRSRVDTGTNLRLDPTLNAIDDAKGA